MISNRLQGLKEGRIAQQHLVKWRKFKPNERLKTCLHDRIMDRPGGVVEEDIHAVWTAASDRAIEIRLALVVDGLVVAEFAARAELSRPARDRDDSRAGKLGELPDRS